MTNIYLVNPGFEEGYREDYDPTTGEKPIHKGFVFEVNVTGGPISKTYTVERGEIHNPKGWWTWYAHQRNDNTPVPWDSSNLIGWSEPETRLSEPSHNRHRSGERAGYLFTWRRIHEGGFFQQINVTSGKKIKFSAYTHAWISNDDTLPATCSLPGCVPLAWESGTPGLNDDQRSVTQWVGIDPTGGTNPYSETVVWSKGWHIFNGYRETPLSVEAIAQSPTVTVFLKSSTLWPVIHNDVAWDDCSFEIEDAPSPGPCFGLPRIQYKRQYLLMHINEPDEMWAQAIKTMREMKVQLTLGQSADDAGIGALDNKEIYAVNPSMWENNGNTLFSFYEQYYPGVKVIPIYAPTPAALDRELKKIFLPPNNDNRGMLIYSQRDPRWANDLIGTSGKTISMIGCAMVACCMRATRIDKTLTPKILNQRLNAAGGYTPSGNLYWDAVAKVVGNGLKFREYITWRPAYSGAVKPNADAARIKKELEKHPIIIQVDFKPNTTELDSHFVVAVRMLPGDDIQIIDPWTGLGGTLKNTYWNGSIENSVYAMVVYDEGQQTVYPWSGKPRISLHNQAGLSQSMREFLRETKPAVWKTFDTGQIAEVWQESPETFIDYRHHLGDDHEWLNSKNAREYVNRFKSALLIYKDYPQVKKGLLGTESLNEVMAGGDIPRAVTWDIDFINVMATELPFVRPIVATIPVGNVEYNELPWLDPLIRASKNGWPVWGYHNYYPAYQGESYLVKDWVDYSGRFERIHEYALTKGVNLFWLFGETGAITRLPGGHMPPEEGWKHPRCLNNNWQKYLQDLITMNSMLKNHKYSNQILGATIFTVGNVGWEYFQLTDDQIRQLSQSIK